MSLRAVALTMILLLSGIASLHNAAIAETDPISISSVKNLSSDNEVSSYPQIAASDTSVYVVWQSEIFKQEAEGTFTEKGVLMRKGMDYGQHFKEATNLVEVRSAEGEGPQWVDIAASLNNVLITWVNGSGVVYSENAMKSVDSTDVFVRSNSACGEGDFIGANNISNSTGTSVLNPPHLDAVGGFAYLVWSEYTEDGADLLFRRSTDSGLTFANYVSLNQETERKGLSSSFLIDTYAYLSDFYVVWTDYDAEGNKDLYLKRSTDYGETFGDVFTIRSVPANIVGGIDDPKVIASNDKVYVVWRDNNTPTHNFGIFFRAITDYGRNIHDTIALSDLSRDSDSPRIAVYENNVYVTWEDHTDPGNPEIFLRASNDGGRTFSETINLSNSDGESRQPEIAASHKNVYVVWREQTDANADILLALSTDNGSTFRTINLSNNPGYSSSPQIVAEQSVGRTYVVWEDATPGNLDIFFRVITDNLSPLVTAPTLGKGLIITEVELDPAESDKIVQWIEVYNPTNSTISTTLRVSQPECSFPSFFLTSIQLEPKEYRVIEIRGEEFGEPGFPIKDTSLSISSNKELDRTPELTDIYADSRTWQRVDGEWVFWNNTPWKDVPNKQLNLTVDEKEFMISIVGTSKTDLAEFNKEMKSITLHVEQEGIENIRITVPKELIGGPYNLSMKQDGYEVKGKWEVMHNSTHASFSRDLPKGITTIEITGTTVIPEFPFAVIIASVAIGVMIAVMRFRKLSNGVKMEPVIVE